MFYKKKYFCLFKHTICIFYVMFLMIFNKIKLLPNIVVLFVGVFSCFFVQANNNKDLSNITQSKQIAQSKQNVSLIFQNIELKRLLHILAETININVIIADNITGELSVNLKDISWQSAFDFILKTKGLEYRIYDNILYIANAEELVAMDKLAVSNKLIMEELLPITTAYQKVYYIDAKKIAELVNSNNASLLSTKGKISYSEDSNTIIIMDIAKNIDKIVAFIKKMDAPLKQIIIETHIVKTAEDLKHALGIKYKEHGKDANNSRLLFDMGINNPTSIINFSLATIRPEILLDLELQALEKENRLTILASPKILTLDKKTAVIESGQEIPYITKSAVGADPQVVFKKAALRLEVTPFVTPSFDIILHLKINKDQPGIQLPGISQAPIDTTQIATEVIAKNGETIVLGGIFSEQETNTVSKVPILGDLPVLKHLFRSTEHHLDKKETLIFVTPRVFNYD